MWFPVQDRGMDHHRLVTHGVTQEQLLEGIECFTMDMEQVL